MTLPIEIALVVAACLLGYAQGFSHGFMAREVTDPPEVRRVRELSAASRRDRGRPPTARDVADYLTRMGG